MRLKTIRYTSKVFLEANDYTRFRLMVQDPFRLIPANVASVRFSPELNKVTLYY